MKLVTADFILDGEDVRVVRRGAGAAGRVHQQPRADFALGFAVQRSIHTIVFIQPRHDAAPVCLPCEERRISQVATAAFRSEAGRCIFHGARGLRMRQSHQRWQHASQKSQPSTARLCNCGETTCRPWLHTRDMVFMTAKGTPVSTRPGAMHYESAYTLPSLITLAQLTVSLRMHSPKYSGLHSGSLCEKRPLKPVPGDQQNNPSPPAPRCQAGSRRTVSNPSRRRPGWQSGSGHSRPPNGQCGTSGL